MPLIGSILLATLVVISISLVGILFTGLKESPPVPTTIADSCAESRTSRTRRTSPAPSKPGGLRSDPTGSNCSAA
ncbi:MAG TPA: hypothetical protein VFB91_03950 [Terriglobales bacterium]|nr:hypothetical protein [Terriglobales bacterium]